jgi:hypothetical protein
MLWAADILDKLAEFLTQCCENLVLVLDRL